MEKNHKKDLEHLLIKQTEKILQEIDPTTTVVFLKNIKSNCKDLSKKILKIQKKLQKHSEILALEQKKALLIEPKTITKNTSTVSNLKADTKTQLAKAKVVSKPIIAKTNKVIAKKATPKRARKGNNLTNTSAIQNKAKTALAKGISKASKK